MQGTQTDHMDRCQHTGRILALTRQMHIHDMAGTFQTSDCRSFLPRSHLEQSRHLFGRTCTCSSDKHVAKH